MPEAPAPLDVTRILRLFTEAGVEFVVIGGIAAVLQGSPRNTFDLDVCFSTAKANLDALGRVLETLDARLAGVDEEVPFAPDAATLHRIEVLALTTNAGRLDVLSRPPGAPPFRTLWDRAEQLDVGGFLVRVAAIDDLIAMKQAAGRPKDVADIAELETIQRLRAKAG
jgi:hypothetical protein